MRIIKKITDIEEINFGTMQTNNWENISEVNKKPITSLFNKNDSHIITPCPFHLFNFNLNLPDGIIVNEISLQFKVIDELGLTSTKLPTCWLNYSNQVNEHDFSTDEYNKFTTPFIMLDNTYSTQIQTVNYVFNKQNTRKDLFDKASNFINEGFFGFILQFPISLTAPYIDLVKTNNVSLQDFEVIIDYSEPEFHTWYTQEGLDRLENEQFIQLANDINKEYQNIYLHNGEFYTTPCYFSFYLTYHIYPTRVYEKTHREYEFKLPVGLSIEHFYPSSPNITL